MKILCKTDLKIQSGQAVKMIAKHIKKNLGGAYKLTVGANTCDVYFLIYYEVPKLHKLIGNSPGKEEYNKVHEMHIDLNITTYQNKVRVNLIEITPEERTIGYDLYKPEIIQADIVKARELIWNKVQKRLEKAYGEYDFVF